MSKAIHSFIFTSLLLATSLFAGVGDAAKNFTKTTLENGDFKLADHKGKVIYLFFVGYN
ncbi:MAG: hypothetical protein H6696_03480 [Deferribacteres bacterium]|nr:hypothetical protein [candidate division KSB1 bacterium]MCB9500978.1 hypothetical protein [Deferribacteres bacterium]